jgi:hypothetical protein
MRKSILILAMVLASATAQAGPSRSLTLASNDEPAAAVQPKAVETPQATEAPKAIKTKPTEAPQFVERPPAVDTTTTADQPKPDAAKPVAAQTAKPKHKHYWSEARIIGELHRHGVYW